MKLTKYGYPQSLVKIASKIYFAYAHQNKNFRQVIWDYQDSLTDMQLQDVYRILDHFESLYKKW